MVKIPSKVPTVLEFPESTQMMYPKELVDSLTLYKFRQWMAGSSVYSEVRLNISLSQKSIPTQIFKELLKLTFR